VYNIYIECLWCDVTCGFSRKWSNLFVSLKYSCGLQPDLDAHIWLLHHHFLAPINQDAIDWPRTWNEHKIQLDDQHTRGPRNLFFFGMIENGLHDFDGLNTSNDDTNIDDLDVYGIDGEELHNADVIAHHAEQNADQELNSDDLDN
ncbi:hypothetical protein K438DRAFT_1435459, partial [Mycena galopus ATCC 62051]